MLLRQVLSNIGLDSYFQLLIVPSNGQNQLDIGPDELIQLVPSFQSMCLIKHENDTALKGLRVLVGMLLRQVLSNIGLDSYFQLLIVPSNVQNQLDIRPEKLIQLVPSFQSMYLIKHEKDSAL